MAYQNAPVRSFFGNLHQNYNKVTRKQILLQNHGTASFWFNSVSLLSCLVSPPLFLILFFEYFCLFDWDFFSMSTTWHLCILFHFKIFLIFVFLWLKTPTFYIKNHSSGTNGWIKFFLGVHQSNYFFYCFVFPFLSFGTLSMCALFLSSFSWSLPNSCFRRDYYGLNDWMPQIPEGIGHGSQRDMINSCFHAQWPWPGPCGEEPLYHRHHTDVWAKQDHFAIHLQGPQRGRKTTVRRSNARRDAPRHVGFAHRKRDIVPSLRVHASYHNIPWMRRTKLYGHLMSITREREQLAASETRLSSYGTLSK